SESKPWASVRSSRWMNCRNGGLDTWTESSLQSSNGRAFKSRSRGYRSSLRPTATVPKVRRLIQAFLQADFSGHLLMGESAYSSTDRNSAGKRRDSSQSQTWWARLEMT